MMMDGEGRGNVEVASALAWPRWCHRMCSVKEIWDCAVFCFVPCKSPESTVARLCCGAGWAVCRAGGSRDALRHTGMPSGKEPLQTAKKGCPAPGLPAFPSSFASCLGEDAVMPRCPRDFDGTGGHSSVYLSLWGRVWGSISLAGLCMGHVQTHSSLTQLCPGEPAHPKAAPFFCPVL